MKDKKEKLLKNLVRKSIPVSQQTFDLVSNPQQESDQYIVDGPALRELLRAYRWNYDTIKKHKNWKPTFHWKRGEKVDSTDENRTENLCQKEVRDNTSNRQLIIFFSLVGVTALAIVLIFLL